MAAFIIINLALYFINFCVNLYGRLFVSDENYHKFDIINKSIIAIGLINAIFGGVFFYSKSIT